MDKWFSKQLNIFMRKYANGINNYSIRHGYMILCNGSLDVCELKTDPGFIDCIKGDSWVVCDGDTYVGSPASMWNTLLSYSFSL